MPNLDVISNPNQRTLCALVLDASGSMDGSTSTGRSRISELNNGIEQLHKELLADPVAAERVVLAVITVGGPSGGANLIMDWADVRDFSPFPLTAGGTTPLGEGVLMGLQLIEQGKSYLRSSGIGYLRPWLMIITDGEPTDDQGTWSNATASLRAAEKAGKCVAFPIAVDGANKSKLSELSASPAREMSAVKFTELFQWLSASLSVASSSAPGATVQLPSTDPWAGVKL